MPNGEETIDDKVNAAAPGGGIFNSIGSSLEDLVGVVKKIPYYTYYTAKAAAGLAAGVAIAGASALVGAPISVATATNVLHAGYSALILPAGIAAGTWLSNLKNKVKTKYSQIMNQFAIGGILGGYLNHVFAGATHVGNLVKGACGTIAGVATKAGIGIANIPVFLTFHEYLDRFLDKDHEPKSFKENMGQLKGPMAALIPAVGLNYLAPVAYQMPVAAGVATTYGLLKGEPKKEEQKEPNTIKFPNQQQPYQEKIAA